MATEREKMLSGAFYLSADAELVAMRRRARLLTEAFNASSVNQQDLRKKALSELLGELPEGLHIEPPFQCDYGDHISLGHQVFINFGCKMLDICRIKIGDRALIGPNVQFYAASHPLDADLRREGVECGKPITVGDDCWIGGQTVILPGITIGDRVVIGAGSVVTRDVPSDTVVAGNPARIIKRLDKSQGQADASGIRAPSITVALADDLPAART